MRRLLIRGGVLVLPDRGELRQGDLLIERGLIASWGRRLKLKKGDVDAVLDARGLYVAPGFIDLQLVGSGGYNFEDASPDELEQIIDLHISHGTTGLLPTIMTASIARMRAAIERIRQVKHPAVLGVHLEGPFISERRKGAHDPEFILAPAAEKLDELVKGYEDFIRIITLAPELPGARQLIQRVGELGIVPALGHSDASYEEALKAIDAGITLFTHVFNAMRGFHHREPGAVGAALASDVMVTLIADGIHVHPAAVRLLYRLKGASGICLITDAIGAAGMASGDGEYTLGGRRVLVEGGVARLADGTLAGSTLTIDRAVRSFISFTGASLPEAVRAASLNPARVLGLDGRKGTIAEGKDADLVLFDEDFTMHYTLIGGEVVYPSWHDRPGRLK